MLDKLWLYTNYDCNLACTYCVAESHPRALRRGLDLPAITRLVDEAVPLGFQRILLTGGEPFLLDDIYAMIIYASAHLPTTVLTNGLLLHGRRLARLSEVASDALTIQVSLDGAAPEQHDPYRGAGTWRATVDAIERLLEGGFRVRVATTVTPVNAAHVDELQELCRSLGIAGEDHVVRPLAHRGFATEGDKIEVRDLLPEVTATSRGVFWHPIASPGSADMLVTPELFPLADAVAEIERLLAEYTAGESSKPRCVT
jgi:MoaA/NifB/PqqE/SkfB family radical SAM enzyme